MIIPVRRFFSGADSTVCKAAPAKFFGVRIKCFLISASSRHPYHIIIPCYRAEIADNHDIFLHFIYPAENNNILLVVIRDKPLKPFPGILYLPERRMLQVIMIELCHILLQLRMLFVPEQQPIQLLLFVPFNKLPKLLPHEQQLLPGCAII